MLLIPWRSAAAQLLSPGKLSRPHAYLEGIRNCTKCHRLRERGVVNDVCLDCHTPLRDRLANQKGFHATVRDQSCSECHKDHFGLEFDAVRLDTAKFDHEKTGYRLRDGHVDVPCRDCHQPQFITAADVKRFKTEHGTIDKTLLGLGSTCELCHERDDPHERQFPRRRCQECHDETTWEDLDRFDHNATRYRLTGEHRDVKCEECHEPTGRKKGQVRWVGLDFDNCTPCHDDAHSPTLGQDCAGCHVTADWHRISAKSDFEREFDHEKTEFPLRDKHADAECKVCHDLTLAVTDELRFTFTAKSLNYTYPVPVVTDCVSCHRDYHRNVFASAPGGIDCESCHDEKAWVPSAYGVERHNRDAEYELAGAHQAVPCFACHGSAEIAPDSLRFHIDDQECESCHEEDDPHGTQFTDKRCKDCHDTKSYKTDTFDHDATEYALDGKHKDVPCNSCHPLAIDSTGRSVRVYKPLKTDCRSCHGGGS